MKFLLVTIGSHGDVHPFVGIGAELLRRGHCATLITSGYFESLARRARLDFVPLGTADDYLRLASNADLWSRRNGWRVVFGSGLESLRKVYDAITARLEPDTVVIASSLGGLAARVAQDKHRMPLATVHLSPSIFRSSVAPPRLPGLFMPSWMPLWVRRAMWRTGDRLLLDPVVGPPINALRAELGLPPVKNLLDQWWHSPDLVIGLFPEWFAPIASDWPAQTVLTGFPLFDERGHEPLPESLERFLAAGAPPVAFTPGSAMVHGHDFFRAAADACARGGLRGILLSRHASHIPTDLPAGVIHVPYAPFSELLPRCAALVHHGGIGTTSQALRAGTPQLIMAMTHDQPDNALRVERLGCGRPIAPRKFTGARVAAALRELVDRPEVSGRCRTIASRFEGVDALGDTCALIEQLGNRRRPSLSERSPVAEAAFTAG